jgi:hypothetical protein
MNTNPVEQDMLNLMDALSGAIIRTEAMAEELTRAAVASGEPTPLRGTRRAGSYKRKGLAGRSRTSIFRRDAGPHEGLPLRSFLELLTVRALPAAIEHSRING